MKTLLLALSSLAASTLMAQPSIDLGFTSRMQATASAAFEQQLAWSNTQANVRVATDNYHPVMGLQTGYSTTNDFQQWNIRFLAGAFFHTGLLTDKDTRIQTLRFGGSIRAEMNHGIISMEYNGETLQLTLGFMFKKR